MYGRLHWQQAFEIVFRSDNDADDDDENFCFAFLFKVLCVGKGEHKLSDARKRSFLCVPS